jgi:hypothetical protein
MGGQENAQKLISRLEDGLEQEQAMAIKYAAAKTPAKLTAAGYVGWKTFSGIVSALMGKSN